MNANGKTRTAPLVTYRVEVVSKNGFVDPAGTSLLSQLPMIGIQSASAVRVGSLYDITGSLSLSHLHAAAQGLLADPITQEFSLNTDRPAQGMGSPHWRIEVWLKPSVTDSVGESVCKAMTDLGLPTPARVRCGAVYRIQGRVSQSQAEKIAVKFLANPIVHQYSVRLG